MELLSRCSPNLNSAIQSAVKGINNKEKYVTLFICCWFMQDNEDTEVEEVSSKPKGAK
jgi:hypothetical protein